MYTENEIAMHASPERVFRLAAEVAHWPRFLPHYRWVRVLEAHGEHRIVEMAARRGPFPVRWTARQRLRPDRGRIVYKHVRGLTAGMDVEWRLTPTQEGTHVLIVHDLPPHHWLLRTRLGAWIVGEFFIRGIAAQTLVQLKRAAESEVEISDGARETVGRPPE